MTGEGGANTIPLGLVREERVTMAFRWRVSVGKAATRWVWPLALLLLWVTLLAGCSMTERRNRRLLTSMDEDVRFESPVARVAWAPVFVPVGTAALAVDAAVVHPVAILPKCWRDTYSVCWKQENTDPYIWAVYFGPRAVLTPVVFAGDWIGRILLPIG